MKRYVSKEVDCPFYHSEDNQKIYCEGIQNGSSIHLAFGNPTDMKEYRNRYCCKDFDKCRIADMLYTKYEEEDEDE